MWRIVSSAMGPAASMPAKRARVATQPLYTARTLVVWSFLSLCCLRHHFWSVDRWLHATSLTWTCISSRPRPSPSSWHSPRSCMTSTINKWRLYNTGNTLFDIDNISWKAHDAARSHWSHSPWPPERISEEYCEVFLQVYWSGGHCEKGFGPRRSPCRPGIVCANGRQLPPKIWFGDGKLLPKWMVLQDSEVAALSVTLHEVTCDKGKLMWQLSAMHTPVVLKPWLIGWDVGSKELGVMNGSGC